MCTFREWNNEIENQNSKWKTLGYIICATICEQLKCTVFLIQVTDSIAVIVATQFRCVREWMRKLIILGFFFQLKLQPNDKCLLHTHFQFSAPTKIMTRTECWCSNYWNSRPHKHTFRAKWINEEKKIQRKSEIKSIHTKLASPNDKNRRAKRNEHGTAWY